MTSHQSQPVKNVLLAIVMMLCVRSSLTFTRSLPQSFSTCPHAGRAGLSVVGRVCPPGFHASPLLGSMASRPSGRRSFVSRTSSLNAIKTAIVGMPNVGKSTLFNALTETQGALAANYPFATIEPNVGIVEVPDTRLPVMAKINQSVKTIPASLEFVDVAGLVKGASDGEGLGNKFLANIRECDAIVHVVRCFEDENVIHVDGSVDPMRDADVINLELVLADGSQVDKR